MVAEIESYVRYDGASSGQRLHRTLLPPPNACSHARIHARMHVRALYSNRTGDESL